MIEEVSFYRTSDGSTFEYEEDAYNYETEYALKKANIRIFDIDMKEITKDDYSSNTYSNVYCIIAGDSNEEDLDNAADMIYDWVDSSVDTSKIKPNTTIIYDSKTEEWVSVEQLQAHVNAFTERLNQMRSLSKETHA